MSENLNEKLAAVIDNGLFTYIAEAIAPAFKKVLYWSPWASAFPDDKSMQVGVGLPGVTRADWWMPYIPKTDLFIFPDCYHGPDQEYLESIGKRVWGSRCAEDLELEREESKIELKELGIPIGPFAVCEGMDELRSYLKDRENVLVKFSFTRGDKETFHVENYELAEDELNDLEHRLGPRANKRKFIVEESIEPACEIASDGYIIDGQFPEACMWGVEVKGKAYAGLVTDCEDLPDAIKENNEKVAPLLKKCHARSWFGMETRVTKKEHIPYVIDPLVRFGNPPGALCSLMYRNLAEIFYHGANGEMVQPEFEDKWGVQLQIYSSFSEDHWQRLYFPDKIAKYVKLQYHTIIDGVHCVIPTADKNPAVGSVVATGATLEEAIEKAEGYADQVKGPGIKIDGKVLEPLKQEFEDLKKYGINIER